MNAREKLDINLPTFEYGDYCSEANFDSDYEYFAFDSDSGDYDTPIDDPGAVLGAIVGSDALSFDLTGYSESSAI